MRTLIFLIFSLIFSNIIAQQPVRRLPSSINHPSLNLFAPFISADGNALLFISNSGQDGAMTVSYTARDQDWSPPAELPKHLNSRLNFTPGYALSANGKRIYFTCAKSPTIGGYDIFTSELKGNVWSNPENLTLPINSKTHEGSPSFTTDGNTIYFMRCDKMDISKADGCKIFRSSKKQNGQWEEPVELPANINTGNSQAPRIMADQQTLIFSSNKMNGQGGMDLFVTKFSNGTWSDPVALDFVNTPQDDQYISVSALGRYLLKETRGSRNNYELTEYLIPQNLRPKGLMKVEGKITLPDGTPAAAYISLTDLNLHKRIYSGRPLKDGSYFLYIPEGSLYELSIDPEMSEISWFSKGFDLNSEKIPQVMKVNAVLKQPVPGDEFALDLVTFKSYTSELDTPAFDELKRLARMARANPGLKFEIQVLMKGYREDFQQTDPDLTESIAEEMQTMTEADSAVVVATDSTTLAQADSAVSIEAPQRVRYHNDRTHSQAQAIIDYLAAQGTNPAQLTSLTNAIPSIDGTNELTIKVRVTQ
jgi:hypothetical protein